MIYDGVLRRSAISLVKVDRSGEMNISYPLLMATHYVYSALPSNRHIRLLDLKPGRLSEPISCSLYAVAIDNMPTYTALSYTWGEPKLDHVLWCDGKEVRITSSLHAALQQLRLSGCSHLVWADAVCINQCNDDERSEQVRLMRYIYSGARETIAFLGDPGEEAKLAVELGEMILDLADTLLPTKVNIDADEFESYGLPPSRGKEWTALGKLFSASWFKRVWVIQEYALSRHLSFRWGEAVFALDHLIRLRSALGELGLVHEIIRVAREVCGISPFLVPRFLAELYSMEALRKAIETRGFPRLYWLLDRTSLRESTDPRDQIYALLGVSNSEDEPELLPNYAQDVQQTYARICRWFLGKTGGGPRFLHLVGLPRSQDQLPSWIPDFSTTKALRTLRTPRSNGSYNAGGPTEIGWRVTEDLRTLIAQGAIVDIVDECLEDLTYGVVDENYAPADGFIPIVLKWFMDSFNMTKCSMGDVSENEIMKRHVSALFFDVMDPGEGAEVDLNTYVAIAKFLAGIINETNELEPAIDLAFSAAIETNGWKFCLTKNGKVGYVPAESLSGDKVCIIPGMQTPFMIRNHQAISGSFYLVGECFIHGLMYGEAIGLEDFQIQEIRLVSAIAKSLPLLSLPNPS
jgi:hypothetical protein